VAYFFALFLLFFFSSRRRHTRFSRDWSSDVCSSDLLYLKGRCYFRNSFCQNQLRCFYTLHQNLHIPSCSSCSTNPSLRAFRLPNPKAFVGLLFLIHLFL